jgi:hypothetical protein
MSKDRTPNLNAERLSVKKFHCFIYYDIIDEFLKLGCRILSWGVITFLKFGHHLPSWIVQSLAELRTIQLGGRLNFESELQTLKKFLSSEQSLPLIRR